MYERCQTAVASKTKCISPQITSPYSEKEFLLSRRQKSSKNHMSSVFKSKLKESLTRQKSAPRTSLEWLCSPRQKTRGQKSSTSMVKQIYKGGLLSVLSESALGFSGSRGRRLTEKKQKPMHVKTNPIDLNLACLDLPLDVKVQDTQTDLILKSQQSHGNVQQLDSFYTLETEQHQKTSPVPWSTRASTQNPISFQVHGENSLLSFYSPKNDIEGEKRGFQKETVTSYT